MDIGWFLLLLSRCLLLGLVGCVVHHRCGALNSDWNYPCVGLINSTLLLGLWLWLWLWLGWLWWLDRFVSSLHLQDGAHLIQFMLPLLRYIKIYREYGDKG
jgi:hypothetical protein